MSKCRYCSNSQYGAWMWVNCYKSCSSQQCGAVSSSSSPSSWTSTSTTSWTSVTSTSTTSRTTNLPKSPLSLALNLHLISISSEQMVVEHFCMWPTDFRVFVAFSLLCLCAFSAAIIVAGSPWPTVQTVCSCFSLELKSWQVPGLRLSGQQHEKYSGEPSKFYCMRKRPIKWLTIEAISKSSDLKDQKW